MLHKLALSVALATPLILTGCSTTSMDVVSDIVYLTTGVPGPKQNRQAQQAEFDAKQKKAELERKEKEQFKQARQQWIGKSADKLVEVKGSPWGVHNRNDGGKQYTWKRNQQINLRGDYTLCVENFISDKKGILVDWNTSECAY